MSRNIKIGICSGAFSIAAAFLPPWDNVSWFALASGMISIILAMALWRMEQ